MDRKLHQKLQNKMFERYTDRARRIMAMANQETKRFGHTRLEVDFVMLAFLKHGEGVGAAVLERRGIDLASMQVELEQNRIIPQKASRLLGKLRQTRAAKALVKHSIECARRLGHNYVGSEHLLVAMCQSEEGAAAELLRNCGLDQETLEKTIRSVLGEDEAA